MCAGEPPDKGGVLHLGAGLPCGLAVGDVLDDVHMWRKRDSAWVYNPFASS